mgnify:CR=1 FL=1
MSRFGRLASVWIALSLSACAASLGAPRPYPLSSDGWTPQVAELRSVSLGLPGGTQLPAWWATGVTLTGHLLHEVGLQMPAMFPDFTHIVRARAVDDLGIQLPSLNTVVLAGLEHQELAQVVDDEIGVEDHGEG